MKGEDATSFGLSTITGVPFTKHDKETALIKMKPAQY